MEKIQIHKNHLKDLKTKQIPLKIKRYKNLKVQHLLFTPPYPNTI